MAMLVSQLSLQPSIRPGVVPDRHHEGPVCDLSIRPSVYYTFLVYRSFRWLICTLITIGGPIEMCLSVPSFAQLTCFTYQSLYVGLAWCGSTRMSCFRTADRDCSLSSSTCKSIASANQTQCFHIMTNPPSTTQIATYSTSQR